MEDVITDEVAIRIDSFESWRKDFDKYFEEKKTRPFNERLRVISGALDAQDLDKLPEWSPGLAKNIASYLAQNAPEELSAWTKDKMELFDLEGNKRVKQIVASARRQLNLEKA